jgi:hypothetical protein
MASQMQTGHKACQNLLKQPLIFKNFGVEKLNTVLEG